MGIKARGLRGGSEGVTCNGERSVVLEIDNAIPIEARESLGHSLVADSSGKSVGISLGHSLAVSTSSITI